MNKEEQEALEEVKNVVDKMYESATVYLDERIAEVQNVIIGELDKQNPWLAQQIKIKAMSEMLKMLDEQIEDIIKD